MGPILTRRNFIRGAAGAGLAAAGGGYVRWWEPHWLESHRVELALGRGSDPRPPVRVLHLSDFHASRVVPLEFINRAVTLGLAQQPDLIALTGDFFTDRFDEIPRYAAILGRLAAAAPTFACLGNHDGGVWARSAGGYGTTTEVLGLLRAAGIRCLQNEAHALALQGRPLQLIGVGDLWSRQCEPARAFAQIPPRQDALRILLNHNPDVKDALHEFDWDLVLCGHTHGGQLRLPFLGTPFAPVADKRYVEGLHRWKNRWLYVTRGVGNLHGVRFNCRPQVSVITIL